MARKEVTPSNVARGKIKHQGTQRLFKKRETNRLEGELS